MRIVYLHLYNAATSQSRFYVKYCLVRDLRKYMERLFEFEF